MIKYVDPLLTQKACCFSARLLTRKEKTKQTSTLRETPACETIHSVHPNRLPVNHHASPALAASEERSPRCHRLWPHTIVDSAGSGANTCHMAGNSLDQQAASMDSPHQLLDMIQTCSNLNKANLGPWMSSNKKEYKAQFLTSCRHGNIRQPHTTQRLKMACIFVQWPLPCLLDSLLGSTMSPNSRLKSMMSTKSLPGRVTGNYPLVT